MERTWGFVVIEGLCVSETGMYTSPKGDSAISFVRQARRFDNRIWEQVTIWLLTTYLSHIYGVETIRRYKGNT